VNAEEQSFKMWPIITYIYFFRIF